MVTFDQHLAGLVREQTVTIEQGLGLCHSPEDFTRLLGRS
jgi:Tfp pilus assembly pilus retraction ATPase PilT